MKDVKDTVDKYVKIWKSGENPKMDLIDWHKELYAFNTQAVIDALEDKDKLDLLKEIKTNIKLQSDVIKTKPNSKNNLIILMKSCYIYSLLFAELPNSTR